MKAGPGAITLDYGRPSLKGRDMLAQLQEGTFWRMGRNEATVLTTPVDLSLRQDPPREGRLQPLAEEDRRELRARLQLPDRAVGHAARPRQGRRQRADGEVGSGGAGRDVHHGPRAGREGRGPRAELGGREARRALRDREVGEGGRGATLRRRRPSRRGARRPRRGRAAPSGASRRATSTGASHPAPTSTSSRTARGGRRTRSRRRWSAGAAAGRRARAAKDQLKAILDEVSASTTWPKGSVEQLVGDFYAACMDEKKADELGRDADPAAPRRDRRPHRHRRRPQDDRPLPRAGDPGALRPHRLARQPRPRPG